MKSKSFFQFLLAAAVFALAIVVPQEAAALVASTTEFTLPVDPGFLDAGGLVLANVALVSLAPVDGSSYQSPNPGGTRKVYFILKKDVVGVWPKAADIVGGEVTNPPVLKTGKTFAEYDFPDGTCSLDDDAAGDPGFQSYKHTAELMLAGFNKTLTAEVRKHLNAGCVMIVEMNDGQHIVGGASDNPIYFKPGFKSGKKGNDKRGFTLKGEQDGMMWGVMPLAPSVVTALALTPDEDDD